MGNGRYLGASRRSGTPWGSRNYITIAWAPNPISILYSGLHIYVSLLFTKRLYSESFLLDIRQKKIDIWIRDPTYSGIDVKTINFESRPILGEGSGPRQTPDMRYKMRWRWKM